MTVNVARDGHLTVLQLVETQFVVNNVTLTDADGNQHPGVLARFWNEHTALAVELVFDDDGWRRLCAARAGIIIAGQLPPDGPQG